MLVHSARKVDVDGVVERFWMRAEHGVIVAVGDGDGWRAALADVGDEPGAEVVDAAGATLTPGLVDLHCHGGGGHDTAGTAHDIADAVAFHRAHGTTRMLASLVSAPLDELRRSLEQVGRAMSDAPGLLGAHLEGPFLAAERRGAHPADALVAPTSDAVDALLTAGADVLRTITIAPELPGALEAIARFATAGVVPAVGHTAATYAEAAAGFDAGARLLTHTFNAMPGVGHREPGPVGAALDRGAVALELILDGRHVHPSVAALLLRAAPGRVALITDAMAAAGCGDGDYALGDAAVEVRDGAAVLAGTETLAGSTLTLADAVRRAIEIGVDESDAVTAATAVPAVVLGGTADVRVGSRLDAVLWRDDWSVARILA